MRDLIDFFVGHVLIPWMPAWVQIAVLSFVGHVMRTRYLTPEMAKRSRLWLELRRSMPFHPLVVGGLWGAIPSTPRLWFIGTYQGQIQQGVVCGMLSLFTVWALGAALDHFGVKKPDLPGDSEPPK
jgi:hypothetical protein